MSAKRIGSAVAGTTWTVIYPEQLPVNEQLRQLRQAQVIAGHLAVAFHLLFAFGALPRGPLLLTLGFPGELTQTGRV